MGNGKRTPRKPWVVFGRALALSLGIYLAGHLLLAALLVRGTVGEGAAFAVTAGLCVIASAAGAFWAAGQAGMGRDELEYTDEVTLGRSIVNRTPFSGTA